MSTETSPSARNDLFEIPTQSGNNIFNRPLYYHQHHIYITDFNYFKCCFYKNHTCKATLYKHCTVGDTEILCIPFYILYNF